jgi:hypothetical protein
VVATSPAWVIPSDGYLFAGCVVAFAQYYSLVGSVGPARTVVAVAALGAALSVVSAAMGARAPEAARPRPRAGGRRRLRVRACL